MKNILSLALFSLLVIRILSHPFPNIATISNNNHHQLSINISSHATNRSSIDKNSIIFSINPPNQSDILHSLLFKIILFPFGIIGLALTFFGFKLLKFSIFVINTAVAAILVYSILAYSAIQFENMELILLILSFAIGAFWGYFALKLKKIAYFVIGAGFCCVFEFIICSTVPSSFTGNDLVYVILALSAIIGGVITLRLSK